MNNYHISKKIILPPFFTGILLSVVILSVFFNFNVDVFKVVAQSSSILGGGTGGFIARWIMNVPTLSVSLTASPGVLTLGGETDLGATVSGTAIGTINYNFWFDCPLYADAYNNGAETTPTFIEASNSTVCGSLDTDPAPGIQGPPVNTCAMSITGNGYKCDGRSSTSETYSNYIYSTPGIKKPIVIVQREGLEAMGMVSGSVTVNGPPSVSNATVSVNNSNYCSVGPHATITWTYSDPAGSPQTAYEALINGTTIAGSAIDPTTDTINTIPDPATNTGLNPVNVNPEWRQAAANGGTQTGPLNGCNSGNGDANPQDLPTGGCQITWNTTYTAWVRVKNSNGIWSPWTRMSSYVNGANPPIVTDRWTTPAQSFPNVSFTFSPANPSLNSPITFTDTTVFQGAATPRTWVWNFNYPAWPNEAPIYAPPRIISAPGTSGATTNGNIAYTYASLGAYTVQLTATDNLGQSCSMQSVSPIQIQRILPKWREVAPR